MQLAGSATEPTLRELFAAANCLQLVVATGGPAAISMKVAALSIEPQSMLSQVRTEITPDAASSRRGDACGPREVAPVRTRT